MQGEVWEEWPANAPSDSASTYPTDYAAANTNDEHDAGPPGPTNAADEEWTSTELTEHEAMVAFWNDPSHDDDNHDIQM